MYVNFSKETTLKETNYVNENVFNKKLWGLFHWMLNLSLKPFGAKNGKTIFGKRTLLGRGDEVRSNVFLKQSRFCLLVPLLDWFSKHDLKLSAFVYVFLSTCRILSLFSFIHLYMKTIWNFCFCLCPFLFNSSILSFLFVFSISV